MITTAKQFRAIITNAKTCNSDAQAIDAVQHALNISREQAAKLWLSYSLPTIVGNDLYRWALAEKRGGFKLDKSRRALIVYGRATKLFNY